MSGTGRNPLQVRQRIDLIQYACRFFEEHNLQELVTQSDFVKGALYFRDPQALRRALSRNNPALVFGKSTNTSLDLTLTHLDKVSIEKFQQDTRRQKWKNLSKAHRLILATCSLAAVTQGWDQSSMSGANLGWPSELALPLNGTILFPTENTAGSTSATATNVWLFGLINGACFLSGSIIGFFFTDPLSRKYFGRRSVLFLSGLFSFAAVLASALVTTWEGLFISRLALGVGMGSKASIVPILLSETAATEIRGMMVTSWQMADSFGIFLGAAANMAVFKFSQKHSWRYMLAVATIPALLLFLMVFFCIESPRWLLRQGRVKDALKALIQTHELPSPLVACGDLLLMHESLHDETRWLLEQAKRGKSISKREKHPNQSPASIDPKSEARATADGGDIPIRDMSNQNEGESRPLRNGHPSDHDNGSTISDKPRIIEKANIWTRWKLMFITQRMRTAVYASMAVMIAQQACGINLFAFLSATFYLKTVLNLSSSSPSTTLTQQNELTILTLSLIFGLVNFIFSFLAFLCIDWTNPAEGRPVGNRGLYRWLPNQIDRRTLLNISFPLMTVFLILGGLVLLAKSNKSVVIGWHYAFLYLFTAAYSIGVGPMAFLITSEVLPLVNKEIGMSFAVFWNFGGAAFISIFAPVLLDALGGTWLLVLFAGLNICFWIVCYVLVPDTQGYSLESITGQLEATVKEMIRYRWITLTDQFHRGDREEPIRPLHVWVQERRAHREAQRTNG